MNSEAPGAQPWKQVDIGEATARIVFERLGIHDRRAGNEVRILDFGCGNGRYMRVLSRLVPTSHIYGVDVEDDAFEELESLGYHCTKLSERRAALPFDTSMFDCVFSSNVIEHIPRSRYLDYLREIFRVLIPGGVFAIGGPNYPIKRLFDLVTAWRCRDDPEIRRYYLYDDPSHVNPVSVRMVASDLRAAGFVDIDLPATELPLQRYAARLRSQTMKRRLKVLGNKFFGSCRKPP